MARKKLIAGNWKMNLTVPEAISLAQAVSETAGRRKEVDTLLCPSYTLLHSVADVLRNSPVSLGAQDVFWEGKGAFTGQVSAGMLRDAGCAYCIVGHSEKRGRFGSGDVDGAAYFGDTDETVAKKLVALSFAGIAPILCVGETMAERNRGDAEVVIVAQLEGALQRLAPEESARVVVAYEPVWAIGTGKVCDALEANRICGLIRDRVKNLTDADVGVLYGGSVKADNASEVFAQPNIGGALVGGASLNADEFSRIIFAA